MLITFQIRYIFFKCTFSNKRQPVPSSGIAQGTLFQLLYEAGGTGAVEAHPWWMQLQNQGLILFGFLFLPLFALENDSLQNETVLTPNLHRCRGRAGTMPVHPKDNVCIPLKRALESVLQTVVYSYEAASLRTNRRTLNPFHFKWRRVSNFKKAVPLVLTPARPGDSRCSGSCSCCALGELGLEESSQAHSRWSRQGRGEWEAAQGSEIAPDSNGLMICGSRAPNQLCRCCTREISTNPQLTWVHWEVFLPWENR